MWMNKRQNASSPPLYTEFTNLHIASAQVLTFYLSSDTKLHALRREACVGASTCTSVKHLSLMYNARVLQLRSSSGPVPIMASELINL